MTTREKLDEYKRDINDGSSLDILRTLAVSLFDCINKNSELKKVFRERIKHFDESSNGNDYEKLISAKFKDFLLFCAEICPASECCDFVEKYKNNSVSVRTSFGADIHDSAEILRLKREYGKDLERQKISEVKDFSLAVVRVLERHAEKKERTSTYSVIYEYKNYDNPTGVLKIGEKWDLGFDGMPAKILNFFYEAKPINDYYNFRAFNHSLAKGEKLIDSDFFRRTIEHINARVYQDTHGKVREIVNKGKSKKPKPNIYRFKKDIF